MAQQINITIVTLSQPCSACYIIEGIVRETFNKLKRDFPLMNIDYIVVYDLKKIHDIDGIEVEKFPAVLIDGEQITAGSIPDKKQIIKFMEYQLQRGENYE